MMLRTTFSEEENGRINNRLIHNWHFLKEVPPNQKEAEWIPYSNFGSIRSAFESFGFSTRAMADFDRWCTVWFVQYGDEGTKIIHRNGFYLVYAKIRAAQTEELYDELGQKGTIIISLGMFQQVAQRLNLPREYCNLFKYDLPQYGLFNYVNVINKLRGMNTLDAPNERDSQNCFLQ